MNFKSPELAGLLRQTAPELSGGEGCDVVFAIFLEPDYKRKMPTIAESLIRHAIRWFQPDPVMSHCELVVPPLPASDGHYTNFATYLGRKSGWQNEANDSFNYYLVDNAPRWRAVPVFASNASTVVREECCKQIDVEYSLARYIMSAAPFRVFAPLMSAERDAPAHCATLAARVLRKALAGPEAPKEVAAWYGPSTLYLELQSHAAVRGHQMGALAFDAMTDEQALAVERLLRAPLESDAVREMGDDACLSAINALTMRACNALIGGDEVSQTLTQKQLATALLRWCFLRNQDTSSD